MESVKIYLSGGMGNLSFEEYTKWRSQVISAIKYGDYDCAKSPYFFNPTEYYNYEEKEYKSDKEVMEFELNVLRKSDLVIVNFNDKNSIGTSMELMLAKELHIPIIGICKDKENLHPWLRECCLRICDDLREAVEYTVAFYLN